MIWAASDQSQGFKENALPFGGNQLGQENDLHPLPLHRELFSITVSCQPTGQTSCLLAIDWATQKWGDKCKIAHCLPSQRHPRHPRAVGPLASLAGSPSSCYHSSLSPKLKSGPILFCLVLWVQAQAGPAQNHSLAACLIQK